MVLENDEIISLLDESDSERAAFTRPFVANSLILNSDVIEISSDPVTEKSHECSSKLPDVGSSTRLPTDYRSTELNGLFLSSDIDNTSTDIIFNDIQRNLYNVENTPKPIEHTGFYDQTNSSPVLLKKVNSSKNTCPVIVLDDSIELSMSNSSFFKPTKKSVTFNSSFISDLSEIDVVSTTEQLGPTITPSKKRKAEDILASLLDSDFDNRAPAISSNSYKLPKKFKPIPITKAHTTTVKTSHTVSIFSSNRFNYELSTSKIFNEIHSSPIKSSSPNPARTQPKVNKLDSFTRKELKEANKTHRTKEDSLSEMIVVFETSVYKEFSEQLTTYFKINHTTLRSQTSPFPRAIFWERKVKAIYNSEEDLFIPVAPTIVKEKTVVLFYSTSDFVQESIEGKIEAQLMRIGNDNFYENTIICLEGYDNYLQKLRTSENRKYTARVRQALDGQATITNNKRPKKRSTSELNHEDVEEIIMRLQVQFKVNFFPIKNKNEALEWLESFTYTISNSMYDRTTRHTELANIGNVKSGSNAKECYLQALKQLKFMTAPAANRIYNEYRSIQELYKEFSTKGKLAKGPDGKNLTRASIEQCLKTLLLSEAPQDILAEQ